MAAVLPPNVLPSASMGAPPSFTARKIAATNLPGPIELPGNPLAAKFGAPLSNLSSQHPHHHQQQQQQSSISNLLTPPSNIHGDSLSPISSGSSGTNAAANGLPPYTPNAYQWQATGSGLTPFLANNATAASTQPNQTQSWSSFPPPRGMFSPSIASQQRNSANSPATSTDAQQPPNYDLGALPPFPSSLSQPASLPPVVATQQSHNMTYMTTQGSMPNIPSHTPPNHTDGFMQRPPPTPTSFYGSQPSTTPQQAHFPPFSSASPVHHSPMTATPPVPRISPIGQPMQQFQRGFHQPYPMPGPIMSNMHSPNSQMSLVSVPGMMPQFNSGHAAQMQHMYGGHGAQPQTDRPFKCDQCPQSFNRNHDLKRHKRIHLAVKPFPCGHCDKSFSRKDALKVIF